MSFNMRMICGVCVVAALSVASVRPAFAVPVNVALGMPTTTSSVGFGGVPERGVDGNDATWTHSADTGVNFWQVDLASPQDVFLIEMVNRVDECCGDRLNGVVLSVLDDSLSTIFTSAPIAGATAAQTFSFDNGGLGFAGAQYIRVDQSGNWLSIGEMRAFVDVAPPPFGNLSTIFGTATQSTLGFGLPASNAIDGNRDTISHTNTDDLTPSLTVDLGDLFRMETIDLYTRDGCCTESEPPQPERDYNLTVEVLDGGGNVVYTHPVINPWDGVDPPGGAPILGHGASFSIDLPGAGVIGQSVRVSKVGFGATAGAGASEWLSVAELEIYGSTTVVPEPSSVCLVAMGLVGGLMVVRRRRR